MDNFNWLLQGFADGRDADEPAVRRDRRAAGHRGRRAARHRPGDDGRAAAADHLQRRARARRSSCSPASSTAACTAARPPRSCSTRPVSRRRWSPRSRATRWPRRAAPPRRWRPRRSDRSSPAPSAPLLLAAFAPAMSRFAVTLGAPSYLAIMLLALVDGHRGAGLLQAARRHLAAARAGDRPRRHRLAHRPAARHLRPAAAVRRHRHRGDRGGDLRRRRGAVGGGASAAHGPPRSSRSAGRG